MKRLAAAAEEEGKEEQEEGQAEGRGERQSRATHRHRWSARTDGVPGGLGVARQGLGLRRPFDGALIPGFVGHTDQDVSAIFDEVIDLKFHRRQRFPDPFATDLIAEVLGQGHSVGGGDNELSVADRQADDRSHRVEGEFDGHRAIFERAVLALDTRP